jgi:RNA polymerase sigma factor (sigma-70 family)
MAWRDPLAQPEPLIRRVYAYVAYRIGDGPEAEDITSEVFERAIRYRKSYKPERAEDPTSWLVGIARRSIAESFAARNPLATEMPELADEGDLEEQAIGRLGLQAAVAGLDERDRELIALRYGADLTARRIGELLGLSTNTVEVALHRAIGRLRSVLEDSPDEAPSNPHPHKPRPAVLRPTPREGRTR